MTMAHAAGTGAGTLASDVVYVNGWIPAVVLFAGVFVYVAATDGGWNIVVGGGIVGVSALFAFFMWQSLTDYPLTYRDGDRPTLDVQGTGIYQVWDLEPGADVSTTLDVDGGSDAERLAGNLSVGYGCEAARVRWRISAGEAGEAGGAGDAPLAAGTFGEGERRGLGDVALRDGPPAVVRVTAYRLDDAACDTTLTWRNAGFEGPGHGEFRFLFPMPAE
ncbi:hypothetical protein ACXZ65_10615 [Streptomyces aculeolatus]